MHHGGDVVQTSVSIPFSYEFACFSFISVENSWRVSKQLVVSCGREYCSGRGWCPSWSSRRSSPSWSAQWWTSTASTASTASSLRGWVTLVWSGGTIGRCSVGVSYDVSGGGVNDVDMVGGLCSSGSGYPGVGYMKGLSSVYQPFFFFRRPVVDPDNLRFFRLHAGLFCDFGGRRERYVSSVGSYL